VDAGATHLRSWAEGAAVSLRAITVMIHARVGTFDSTDYLIRPLMREWQRIGIGVDVVRGTKRPPASNLLIPHLDLTVTPPAYRTILATHPRVINRHVTDISKRRISGNLVGRDDPWEGPVIVKTDRNFGGEPEEVLGDRGAWVRGAWKALLRKLRAGTDGIPGPAPSWRSVRTMKSNSYPVFGSLRDVPPEVFGNGALVVERFLPEMLHGDYCLRYYYCCGPAEANILLRSTDMVIKGSNASSIEETPIPAGIREIRERLGIDYGKLDYVLRDGVPVLLDVNRTPAAGTLTLAGLLARLAPRLAEGIRGWLDQPR
jgi:hypothetical protein